MPLSFLLEVTQRRNLIPGTRAAQPPPPPICFIQVFFAFFFFTRSVVLPASARTDFSELLAELAAEEASIIVLLAEGFDGGIVRAIFSQVCVCVCVWARARARVCPVCLRVRMPRRHDT